MLKELDVLAEKVASLVWSFPLVIALCLSGLIFTFYFNFPQIRFFIESIRIITGMYDKKQAQSGEISHFQALCAALSGTVGVGNIGGVAIAIAMGGPGAVFWLWVSGFLGMAVKFSEVTLALKYREISSDGTVHGGPMYTIKNGLSKRFYPLAWIYAFSIIFSTFGAGNMFQSNQMASILKTTLNIPTWASGSFLCLLAAIVLIGGIKRIGKVAESLVPFMSVLYLAAALGIVFHDFQNIPSLFGMIIHDAFHGTAALGGFAGAAFKQALTTGIRRATFSNEAGMGTAAIAHAAAKSSPVQEGIVSLLEPFIDTIVMCTITALALLSTEVWLVSGLEGSEMAAVAFEGLYGFGGRIVVALSVFLFAFATIISWSYYGEQGVTFVFGRKHIRTYRWVYIAFIFIGAVNKLSLVLNLSDIVFAFLALPNLFAIYVLLPQLKANLKEYTSG